MVVQTTPTGPWSGQAFFGTMSQAATEMWGNITVQSELFQHMYPKLTFQLQEGRIPDDYGTTEHREMIKKMSAEAPPMVNRGFRPKHGRWFQVFMKGQLLEKYWAVCAMPLYWIGGHEGWFLATSPEAPPVAPLANASVASASSKAAASSSSAQAGASSSSKIGRRSSGEPEAAIQPEAGATRATLAASTDEVDSLRAKCKNLLHLNLKIYENVNLRAVWMLIPRFVEPIMEENGRFLVMQKTLQGCRQWRLDMQGHLPRTVIRQCWDVLENHNLYRHRLGPLHPRLLPLGSERG